MVPLALVSAGCNNIFGTGLVLRRSFFLSALEPFDLEVHRVGLLRFRDGPNLHGSRWALTRGLADVSEVHVRCNFPINLHVPLTIYSSAVQKVRRQTRLQNDTAGRRVSRGNPERERVAQVRGVFRARHGAWLLSFLTRNRCGSPLAYLADPLPQALCQEERECTVVFDQSSSKCIWLRPEGDGTTTSVSRLAGPPAAGAV